MIEVLGEACAGRWRVVVAVVDPVTVARDNPGLPIPVTPGSGVISMQWHPHKPDDDEISEADTNEIARQIGDIVRKFEGRGIQ
jgi:hypothetical protein